MYSRHTLTQCFHRGRLCRSSRVKDDFDLKIRLNQDSVSHTIASIYLHRTLIHKHAVELDKGLVGATWLEEDDCGDASADTIWTISEHRTFDWRD